MLKKYEVGWIKAAIIIWNENDIRHYWHITKFTVCWTVFKLKTLK